MEIVPVINCPDAACAKAKLAALAAFYPANGWVHLDVTDGIFSATATFADPAAWQAIGSKLSLEVHLMVAHPEAHGAAWIAAGAKHLIVHAEAVDHGSFARIQALAHARGAEVMLAVNPRTPVDVLRPYADICDAFQILAVHPGPAGQTIVPGMIEKIAALRNGMPDAIIEVDGGVDLGTAAQMKAAGANAVAVGTYIFSSGDPRAAYEALKNV